MTNTELIAQHDEDTRGCSLFGHMQKVSTTYKDIIAKGKDIVSNILEYLIEHESGMNIMLLLYVITGETPYVPERITDTEMGSYNINEARNSWINWGKENKFI